MVAFHCLRGSSHSTYGLVDNLFRHGYVGVYIFFLLSAYILFSKYKNTLSTKNEKYIFYTKRFFRTIPMWWIFTSIYYFTFLSAKDLELKHYISNLLMSFGFFSEVKYNYSVIGWSLYVEELFYIFAPIIFAF